MHFEYLLILSVCSIVKLFLNWKNCYSSCKLCSVKGNPNFQNILNWIIKLLHYYCRKQHKNMENSQIMEQNVVISLCPSLCFLRLEFSSPSSTAEFFQFFAHYANFKRRKWSFVLYIVSFSGSKMAFSMLSLAKYHCLHKKRVYSNFNLLCLQLQVQKQPL